MKFKYDSEFGLFSLSSLLPEGFVFPYDFGFVPSTRGGDGDPLDVMVLMDEPAHVGCLLDARLIGVMEAEQVENGETVKNDRLIAIALHASAHEDIFSLTELPKPLLEQVQEFFVFYNKSRGKEFKPRGSHGPRRAAGLLEEGIKTFKAKNG